MIQTDETTTGIATTFRTMTFPATESILALAYKCMHEAAAVWRQWRDGLGKGPKNEKKGTFEKAAKIWASERGLCALQEARTKSHQHTLVKDIRQGLLASSREEVVRSSRISVK